MTVAMVVGCIGCLLLLAAGYYHHRGYQRKRSSVIIVDTVVPKPPHLDYDAPLATDALAEEELPANESFVSVIVRDAVVPEGGQLSYPDCHAPLASDALAEEEFPADELCVIDAPMLVLQSNVLEEAAIAPSQQEDGAGLQSCDGDCNPASRQEDAHGARLQSRTTTRPTAGPSQGPMLVDGDLPVGLTEDDLAELRELWNDCEQDLRI